MPIEQAKIPGKVEQPVNPLIDKYKQNHGQLMADLNERFKYALYNGVDPWGQGLSFAQILKEIRIANEYKALVESGV